MERQNRVVQNPDRLIAGKGLRSKIITEVKNIFLHPDLGYIKLHTYQLSTDNDLQHKEDCNSPAVRVYPIFNVVALPQMAGPVSEYSRKDVQLARCNTCEVEQVLKGGEK